MTEIEIRFERSPTRACGGCTLCCKLLPVGSMHKAAGQRCVHQRARTGCARYHRLADVSPECVAWTCRWLTGQDTADLSRPDRSHYVIDALPDFITVTPPGEAPIRIPVVQVWVDPGYPDAHRDPNLRAYLARRGEEGMAALVRFDNKRGLVIIPPALDANHEWHEIADALRAEPHGFLEVADALAHG